MMMRKAKTAGPVKAYVALLRGINVGHAKRVAMAELRALVEDLGYGDVRTLLNSGNVVFTAPELPSPQRTGGEGSGVRGFPGAATHAADRIEKGLAGKLGVSAKVTVLSATDLAEALRANPLQKVADNPSLMLLGVLRDASAGAKLKPLLKEDWTPEALALGKRFVYLWCADGISTGRLFLEINRAAGDAVTARNWTTMTKLVAMAEKG
jgi:uncharacterized protein (DUF1697 family)